MKKILVFLVISCLLTARSNTVSMVLNNADGSNNVLVVSRQVYEEISEVLFNYFNISSSARALALSEEKASSTVRESLSARIDAFSRMEAVIGCIFDTISVDPAIESIEEIDEKLLLKVYCTTAITYHYPSIQSSNDHMLFGTSHEIEIDKAYGEWRIVRDSFDERSITGVASNDIMDDVCFQEQNTLDQLGSFDSGDSQNSPRTYPNYQAVNALTNAISYCGFNIYSRRYYARNGIAPYPGTPQQNFSHGYTYYNQTYKHADWPAKDCANFVSQCLLNGGVQQDTSGTYYYEKWYYTNAQDQSRSWIGAYELCCYLTYNNYGTLSTTDTVYPGNPVLWGSSAGYHVGICTGYNVSGEAVVCAHTTDAYRVPLSVLTNLTPHDYLGTIKLTNSNQHPGHTQISGTWYYDETQHYHVCQYCEYPCNAANHTFNSQGYCSVCGCSSTPQN